MDCQLVFIFTACVAVAASSLTLPSTTAKPQQLPTSTGDQQNQEAPKTTASSTAPLHGPSNVDRDRVLQWMSEFGKAATQRKGSTPQPTVQTNTVGDSTSSVSTSQNSIQKTTEQTKTHLENEPEVSATSISDVELFYNKLSGIKTRTTESDGETQVKTTGTEKSTTVVHNTEAPSTVNSNTEEDIEWLEKMFQDSTRSPAVNTEQPEPSKKFSNLDTISVPTKPAVTKGSKTSERDGLRNRNKFNLTSPDKFYGRLSNEHPKSKAEALEKDGSESMIKVSSDEFFTTKLIIVSVSVGCGILGILAIIITSYIIVKRRGAIKSVDHPRMNTEKGVFNSGYTDVFHGIPTNNDIWKNLEMLSVNAPAVLPDNHPKV